MSSPSESGGGRQLFGVPAVSISCPRCGRLVAADALSCPRCAQPLVASSPGIDDLRARLGVGTASPAASPTAGAGGGNTAVLPPATGNAPGRTSEPPPTGPMGLPTAPVRLRSGGEPGPSRWVGRRSAPTAPGEPQGRPQPPRAAEGARPAGPRLGPMPMPPRVGGRLRGQGSFVLIGAGALVVVAVLWIFFNTVLDRRERPSAPLASNVAVPEERPVDAASVSARATSVQRPDGRVTYGPENTLDGNLATAWNSRGDGRGARITYTFRAPVDLASITVLNGYQKRGTNGGDLWRLNQRLRTVRVVTSGGTYTWNLLDQKARQTMTRPFGRTSFVRLEVVSTYPSEKYTDVGMSEIGFAAAG